MAYGVPLWKTRRLPAGFSFMMHDFSSICKKNLFGSDWAAVRAGHPVKAADTDGLSGIWLQSTKRSGQR